MQARSIDHRGYTSASTLTNSRSFRSSIIMTTNAHPQALPSSSDGVDIRKKFPRFRILILGRANAGKTTVLKKMCETNKNPIIHNKYGHEVWFDGGCVSNPSLSTSLIMLSDGSQRGWRRSHEDGEPKRFTALYD